MHSYQMLYCCRSSLWVVQHAEAGLQARDALRRSLRALLLQLAQASSVGLIDLKVAESTLGMREILAMSLKQAGRHGRSCDSCIRPAKITGGLHLCKMRVHSHTCSAANYGLTATLLQFQVSFHSGNS